MKALVCVLLFPAALAVWVLGSPRTAWRVITALRRTRRDEAPPQGAAYQVLRVGATLTLVSIVVLIILLTRSD
ncbi:MAG: hypothetical protein ACRDTU_19465 [Micromonosporaceae bacterium]